MPDENNEPATKADISLLKTELRAELATKTELASVKTELREDIARLDKKIDRVAIEVVKTNERIGQLGEDLRQDMRQLNSDITAKLDVFIGKMETIWRRRRISSMSSKSSPPTPRNGNVPTETSPSRTKSCSNLSPLKARPKFRRPGTNSALRRGSPSVKV